MGVMTLEKAFWVQASKTDNMHTNSMLCGDKLMLYAASTRAFLRPARTLVKEGSDV
jgi:hypothetical protein